MRTLIKVTLTSIFVYMLAMISYHKHYETKDSDYINIVKEIDPKSIPKPYVDPRVFVKKDTTKYKGKWRDNINH